MIVLIIGKLNIIYNRLSGENMKNNLENITFDNISLDEYKDDIEKINLMFLKLENDKSVQKAYKKYIKNKKKYECNYNQLKNTNNYDNIIQKNDIKVKFEKNKSSYNISSFSNGAGELI